MKMITLLQATNSSNNPIEFGTITQASQYLTGHNIASGDTPETIKANISDAIKHGDTCYGFTWEYIEGEELPPEHIGGSTIEELKKEYYRIVNRINEIKKKITPNDQFKKGYWTGIVMSYEKEMSVIEELLFEAGETIEPFYQIAIIESDNDGRELTIQVPLKDDLKIGDAVILKYNFLEEDECAQVTSIKTVTREVYDKTRKHNPQTYA